MGQKRVQAHLFLSNLGPALILICASSGRATFQVRMLFGGLAGRRRRRGQGDPQAPGPGPRSVHMVASEVQRSQRGPPRFSPRNPRAGPGRPSPGRRGGPARGAGLTRLGGPPPDPAHTSVQCELQRNPLLTGPGRGRAMVEGGDPPAARGWRRRGDAWRLWNKGLWKGPLVAASLKKQDKAFLDPPWPVSVQRQSNGRKNLPGLLAPEGSAGRSPEPRGRPPARIGSGRAGRAGRAPGSALAL